MYTTSSYIPKRIPLLSILSQKPWAMAKIEGSPDYPDLTGKVRFYPTGQGTLVYTTIYGLPREASACPKQIFGFHIHSGTSCTGNANDIFADALTHYNPNTCEHPMHAGDLPPLFGNNGYALSVFLTDRFTVMEIVGKTVIIHDMPDDFKTQPSGGSGTKIACGVIYKI